MTEFTFPSSNDRETITYYQYIPNTEVTHVVQIIHGMAEHILRYMEFAEYLNQNGIAVFGHDHMAHGKSRYSDRGAFKDSEQQDFMVEDAHTVTLHIKQTYPNAKTTVFCHSMGSFVGRILVARYPDSIDKLIVCGTATKNPLAPVGKYLALTLKLFLGGDFKSKLIDKLSFGSFNNHFKDAKTPSDWLCSDPAEVAKYLNDPDCGFLFSVKGSATLTNLVMEANREKTFINTRNTMPVFIISGGDDPVSNFGSGAKQVYENYKRAGSTDIKIKLYEYMRHEILLDQSKENVMEDVLKFVEKP